jgi:hypothetical protein
MNSFAENREHTGEKALTDSEVATKALAADTQDSFVSDECVQYSELSESNDGGHKAHTCAT